MGVIALDYDRLGDVDLANSWSFAIQQLFVPSPAATISVFTAQRGAF